MPLTPAAIHTLLAQIHAPRRRALSSRFPFLKPLILSVRIQTRRLQWMLHPSLAKTYSETLLPHTIARHQSVLRRKLGDSNPVLQEQKITNLQLAAKQLHGLIIGPGETFSFWNAVGNPTHKRGYVNGMLLQSGKVIEGIGGGLCQLSNLLYWLLLHGPFEVVEHHHHSMDVFPDSGRTLPFGSGATVLYNIADLRMRSTSDYPMQLEVWLTDVHLKARLRSTMKLNYRVHIAEEDHCFILHDSGVFRTNKLIREILSPTGNRQAILLTTNFSPVLYSVDAEDLRQKGSQVLDMRTHKKGTSS